jgi:hypothetical protein
VVNEPRGPDFLGLGAQKAGTSWIYSCLYDHPQVCVPIKEVHFFSRQRNWARGFTWYEEHFARCDPDTLAGEFSTSYLVEPGAAERIHARYPGVRLLACLRQPAERAFSNYLNDLQAGALSPRTSFQEALESHPEYLEQGAYASQLRRYLDLFARESMLILLYDDLQRDPLGFMSSIYRFLRVDDAFVPRMLHERVNAARVPRSAGADRLGRKVVTGMRRRGLDRLVWLAKRSGLPRLTYRLNSRPTALARHELTPQHRHRLTASLKQEIDGLERLLDRDLGAWRC